VITLHAPEAACILILHQALCGLSLSRAGDGYDARNFFITAWQGR